MRVFVNADGGLQVVSSEAVAVPPGFVPAVLDGSAMTASPVELVFDGAKVRHRASVSTWHVDASGSKHALPAPGRQPLAVAWDARLVRENGVWRAETDVERRAPAIRAECKQRITAELSDSTQKNFAAYGAELAFKAATLEGLTDEERADAEALRAAREWVVDMVSACRLAIESGAEPEWPSLPDGVAELAEIF